MELNAKEGADFHQKFSGDVDFIGFNGALGGVFAELRVIYVSQSVGYGGIDELLELDPGILHGKVECGLLYQLEQLVFDLFDANIRFIADSEDVSRKCGVFVLWKCLFYGFEDGDCVVLVHKVHVGAYEYYYGGCWPVPVYLLDLFHVVFQLG